MASSNIRIKKVCEWCGEVFYAQKTTGKFTRSCPPSVHFKVIP